MTATITELHPNIVKTGEDALSLAVWAVADAIEGGCWLGAVTDGNSPNAGGPGPTISELVAGIHLIVGATGRRAICRSWKGHAYHSHIQEVTR